MTALAILLGFVSTVLVIVLLRLAYTEREFRASEKADHAKCMAMVSSVLSRRFTASLVRDLAVKFDSIENQLELGRIRNGYTGDSESVVALWLREQADRIEASHE
jgi:hypothetical protein